MEDLKQIQEFFSKPLNENVFVEAFKLQKALEGMGYDVKVKAVDDFGTNVFEIYFNNPADADDDSIFYDVEKLGYDNFRVFANPQESLDEEKVNRKKLSNDLWDRKGYDYKYLNKLSDKKLKSLWDTEFYHESLDEAYIVTYAKSKGEKPASAAYKLRGSALAFMRDLEKDGYITMLTQKPVDGVDESVKENSHFEKRLAKMAADEKEKRAKSPSYAAASKLDVDIEDFFEKGQSYQEFKKRLDKLKEYNSGIYYDPDKAPKRNKKVSKSTLDKIANIIRKAAVGDYEPSVTEESKPKKGHGEKVSKDFFAKLKGKTVNYKGADYKVIDSDEAVIKLKHEDGDTKTINLKQFNDSGLIDEIIETVLLGRQLNEKKLCKKGEAYRKRRMAAGEKSSAYLSGRAVKVCKGQMSGKKKKKK